MGATPANNDNRKYFNVQDHRFTQRAQEGAEGAVKRVIEKKDGSKKEVWEYVFSDISGHITGITQKDSPVGKQYEVVLVDEKEKMIIQIQADSGYADTLISRLPNVNVLEKVKLVPYSFIPDGETRKKQGINVFQGEQKIVSNYTKENPNGYPSMQALQDAGVVGSPPDSDDWKLFFAKVRKFLASVASEFDQKLKTSHGSFTRQPETIRMDNDIDPYTPDIDTDDLPF